MAKRPNSEARILEDPAARPKTAKLPKQQIHPSVRRFNKLCAAVSRPSPNWLLEQMAVVADWQQMLRDSGVAALDGTATTPQRRTEFGEIEHLRGRVLANAQDDGEQVYMILEGADGTIHFIAHYAINEAWSRGELKPNHLVTLDRTPEGVVIRDLGAAAEDLSCPDFPEPFPLSESPVC